MLRFVMKNTHAEKSSNSAETECGQKQCLSEMRQEPRLAFHLSMPYMQKVIKDIDRMARAGNCQYVRMD